MTRIHMKKYCSYSRNSVRVRRGLASLALIAAAGVSGIISCGNFSFGAGGASGGVSVGASTQKTTDKKVFDGEALLAKTWVLRSFLDGDDRVGLLPGTVITAEFGSDSRVTGNGGCNNYFATFETREDRLIIGNIGSTEMWCIDIMQQETDFLEILRSVVYFEIKNHQLRLFDDEDYLLLSFSDKSYPPED